jgi:hypothetical protein
LNRFAYDLQAHYVCRSIFTMTQSIQEIDPATLHLPSGRDSGADPWKLHHQIKQHGSSTESMPAIFVYADSDGNLEIMDGVTRATRIAKLLPGVTVTVTIIGEYQNKRVNPTTIGDRL